MIARAYVQPGGRGSRLVISEGDPDREQVTGRWIAARNPDEIRP